VTLRGSTSDKSEKIGKEERSRSKPFVKLHREQIRGESCKKAIIRDKRTSGDTITQATGTKAARWSQVSSLRNPRTRKGKGNTSGGDSATIIHNAGCMRRLSTQRGYQFRQVSRRSVEQHFAESIGGGTSKRNKPAGLRQRVRGYDG